MRQRLDGRRAGVRIRRSAESALRERALQKKGGRTMVQRGALALGLGTARAQEENSTHTPGGGAS